MNVLQAALPHGVRLEYALSGPQGGETLLFVHGLGANLRQFEPQQGFFTRQFQVLLVSLRGHGGSSAPARPSPEAYTVRRLARDLVALLSYLRIESVHLVGNSLGGLVGYEMLELAPERLTSLTTFGTTAELHAPRPLLWTQLTLIRLLGPRGMAWLVSRTASRDKAVAAQVGRMLRMASRDALMNITRNIADYNYTATIRRSQLPMLLIRGGLDREINARLALTLDAMRGRPGSGVVDLPHAGHFANLEQPAAFNKVLEEFLRSATCSGKEIGKRSP